MVGGGLWGVIGGGGGGYLVVYFLWGCSAEGGGWSGRSYLPPRNPTVSGTPTKGFQVGKRGKSSWAAELGPSGNKDLYTLENRKQTVTGEVVGRGPCK